MKFLLYAIVIIFSLICSSCSTRRIEKDMTTSGNPQIEEGRLVFKRNCQKCHPNGEAGVGPSLKSSRLPGFLIKVKVRSRAVLLWTGRMPSFKKHEISKRELNVLVAYLKDMRKKAKSKNE